jgi:serine/threonine-protein kinase
MDEQVFAGKYRSIRELSSDSTGRTWLAEASDGEQVVVKVVHPSDQVAAAAIERDIELASGIRHSALPTIVEWGHAGGDFYLVREYVAGSDLKTELAVQGRFAPYTVAHYGSEAAEALSQLHLRGVVHGNVRTANLMRLPSDEVKLVGSGLGVREAATFYRAGVSPAVDQYLAPERIEGEPPSVAADIYALGVVLYELVTGHPPFEGGSAAEVSDRQLHAMPESVRAVVPEVPEALDAVIMRALEKAPESRWQSAEEMRSALEDVERAESPVPVEEPVAPRPKPTAALWTAGILVVALLALGAAWALGFFGTGGIAVPDLVGKTVPQAREAVVAAGLEVGTVTYAGVPVAAVADGLVSEQAPLAGSSAPKGTKVDLILAGREMLTVPDATHRQLSDAESVLENAGLTVGTVTTVTTTTVAAGLVTSQKPVSGSQASKGSAVDLWVAQAPATAAVPDVGGLSQIDANTALVNLGFVVAVLKQSSSTVASGLVIDQAPAAGVTAQVGSTVTIRVSSGPSQATIPDVIGKTQAGAVNALSAAGFLTQVTLQTGGGTVGTVIDQSPAGGTRAARGTTVVVTVVQ